MLVWNDADNKKKYDAPEINITESGLLNIRFEGSSYDYFRGYLDDLSIK